MKQTGWQRLYQDIQSPGTFTLIIISLHLYDELYNNKIHL